ALRRAEAIDESALREAALAGGAAGLARLAQRLDPAQAPPDALVLDDTLKRDLAALAARCQQRDRLGGALPAAFAARLNAGVRALLAGPSGTGKTLAAQVLARELGLPLFRLDLSAVVSKYIGETERNLHRLLSAAQALDVMLLLDEGDALLAPRTEVGSSNDRYANLETNFLLQRLESHQGLVLVTTNALARIDSAFMRRFDFVIPFRAPEFAERLRLWQAHLPVDHGLSDAQLSAVAEACTLAGGQVRNVVLDAVSAALACGGAVNAGLLLEALQREYRRGGGLCPLSRL
ncbi:MAG: ATP-binding protein, partial [Burkholderiales bacterium]|nr:ATP-binding protein [Burkholderiales bacterium]